MWNRIITRPRKQVNGSEYLYSITALLSKHFLQSEHCWELIIERNLTGNFLPGKQISYWGGTCHPGRLNWELKQHLRLISELGHSETSCFSVRRGSYDDCAIISKCFSQLSSLRARFLLGNDQPYPLVSSFFFFPPTLYLFIPSLIPFSLSVLPTPALSGFHLTPVNSVSLILLCPTNSHCLHLASLSFFSSFPLILSFSIFNFFFFILWLQWVQLLGSKKL